MTSPTAPQQSGPTGLDHNQRELISLMARGWSNGEIAASLGAPLPLVKAKVAAVIEALGAATREEAIDIWVHRKRRPAAALGLTRVLGVAAVGGFSVVVVVALAGMFSVDGTGSPTTTAESDEGLELPAPLANSDQPRAKCPGPPASPSASGAMSEADIVQFGGISYMRQSQIPGAEGGVVEPGAIGPLYGVITGAAGATTDSAVVDCSASRLPPGAELHSVGGYAPSFRLATADGVVYEAVASDRATATGEYFDLQSRVEAIILRDPADGTQLGKIEDSRSVALLTSLFLESEPGSPAPDGEKVWLTFELFDGSSVARPYGLDDHVAWPNVRLPSRFNDAILLAIGR
ncbi:MAG: hypothetical protein ABI577_17745 [bacterium]